MGTTKLIVLVFVVFCFGCTTMKNVKVSEDITNKISVGDYVVIQTKQLRNIQFTVEYIDLEIIKGDHVEIPINDIKSIKKKGISTTKTTAASVFGLVAILAISATIAFLSFL